MSRALLYLPGRDQIFARVLRQFIDHYGQGVPGLAAALQAGHWVEAGRRLHSLRGACGAVGATGVQAKAQALEQAMLALAESGTPASSAVAPEPAAQALHTALLALVSAVQSRLDVSDQPAQAPQHAPFQ